MKNIKQILFACIILSYLIFSVTLVSAHALPVEEATPEGATVSDEVDVGTETDPEIGTDFFLIIPPDPVIEYPDMSDMGIDVSYIILVAVFSVAIIGLILLADTSSSRKKYIITGLLIVFGLASGAAAASLTQTQKVKNQMSEIVSLKNDLTWDQGMLEINPDYKGWIKVENTPIDYPVVQGDSNDSYLRRDFYGHYSVAGTPFLDERIELSSGGNVIIYGHMMRDKTMFGALADFKNENFFDENGAVSWDSETGSKSYQIFAGLIVPENRNGDGFISIYDWANLISDQETQNMLQVISDRAFFHKSIDYHEGDTFLFLVTCDNSQTSNRLILVAKST